MQFGPISRALLRNKLGTSLLVIQIALTLAVLMNAVALMLRANELMTQDTGVDLDNVIVVQHTAIDAAYDETDYRRMRLEEDLRILRAIDGVIAATASNAAPSTNGSMEGVSLPGVEAGGGLSMAAGTFFGDEQFLDAIGVELIEGRGFHPEEINFNVNPVKEAQFDGVIITEALADRLYPDGSALGKQMLVEERLKTIIGVSESFEGSLPYLGFFGISPDVLVIYPSLYSSKSLAFLIRVEPGMAETLKDTIERKLLEADTERDLRDIDTLATYRETITGTLRYANLVLMTISGLLVLTTGLGIFGLATFSVAKRRKQIGTRRALGASRMAIVGHFMTENLVITGCGVALGLMLGLGLNVVLTMAGLTEINVAPAIVCVVFIVLLGFVAVLVPALRAARVPPAVATRTA